MDARKVAESCTGRHRQTRTAEIADSWYRVGDRSRQVTDCGTGTSECGGLGGSQVRSLENAASRRAWRVSLDWCDHAWL
jgi:hypothetical protein